MSLHRFSAHGLEEMHRFLATIPQQQSTVVMTFAEIEAVLGEPLPDSASEFDWWMSSDAPNELQATWLETGFGIGSFASRTTTFPGRIEFARGLQTWPTITVDSLGFGQQPVDERYRELALGYAQSARVLCNRLGEEPGDLTWPRASVVCFCYRHAVELLLKSCILHREPVEKCGHNISNLRKQYLRLYPQPVFELAIPYCVRLEDIDELFGEEFGVEDFEKKPDQVYRYFSDKQGRTPKLGHVFAPGKWLSMVEQLENDIARIWDNIRQLESGVEPDEATD